MGSQNESSSHPEYFLLVGIPGMEDAHFFFSIPFCSMYILALAGNLLLIYVIATNTSLHQPMYQFLVMLAMSDILLCTTTVPKSLAIFWFQSSRIPFDGCIAQVFFIHFLFVTESSVLLTMAYDRYVAICYPLAYTTKMTNSFIWRVVIVALTRGFCTTGPFTLLLKRLPYQGSNVIAHSYCEHMAMAKLATADILVNVVYGLIIAFGITGIDMILIAVSYVVIIRAVIRLPSSEARYKAFNTCVSHLCVITLFYVPAFFSFITHRVGHNVIPLYAHILLANLYCLVPPMMNPIIYGVKTKEIRRKVFGLFCRKAFLM
uniref:Olfactory receptor n=1 Tax=Xenopus tropicalis TaxID=8364 RepID=A0A1B8XTZ5_XENTR